MKEKVMNIALISYVFKKIRLLALGTQIASRLAHNATGKRLSLKSVTAVDFYFSL
ncbi:hypothetical protein [Bacillus sp. RS11]|uniref:hypothetical protein n=1 Tax=Lysinibacillus sp. RS11 TaxID=3242682 RepID=UPI0035C68AB3